MRAMRGARDGWYEVAQRLPDLTGELAGAAQLQGDVGGVPLIALMRHCEDNALTCTITVISGFDRACIEYRAGEIARVELNGVLDDDALPQIVRWPEARFRVAAPPLDLDVEGWPMVRRAPTEPARIGRGTPIELRVPTESELAPPPTPLPVPPRAEPAARPVDLDPPGSGVALAWILFAAAVLLGAGVSGLLLFV
jgi:hypothetical protein